MRSVRRHRCPRNHSCVSAAAAADCVYCRRADQKHGLHLTKPAHLARIKGGWQS